MALFSVLQSFLAKNSEIKVNIQARLNYIGADYDRQLDYTLVFYLVINWVN